MIKKVQSGCFQLEANLWQRRLKCSGSNVFKKTYVSAASLIKEGNNKPKDDKKLVQLLGDANLNEQAKNY